MPLPLINKPFGSLILRECIGAGGAAEVWRAERASDHRSFAVKVLRPERREDKAVRSAFEREAKELARLKHPAIPPLRAQGEVEGLPAFAMDYAPGTNLAVLHGKGVAFPALSALAGLVEVVAFLHGEKLVHNDLKLDNAVWGGDGKGRLWLVDFGNARRVGMFSPITGIFRRGSTIFGTATYLAPELSTGGRPTYASDCYALGVCCFLLLSGRPPFAMASTQSSKIRANRRTEAPRIAGRIPAIPPAAGEVIDRCLAKDPSKRVRDAGELLEAVRSLQGRLPEMAWKG